MSRTVVARMALLGALAAGVLGAQGGASAHPAQASKTYTDAKHGYTFQYPSNWKLLKVKTSDQLGAPEAKIAPSAVLFVSPDQLTIGGVLVHTGATATAAIKRNEKAMLLDGITPLSKLSYSVKSINGVHWPFSEMLAKSSSGAQADEFVAATSHGAYTYYVLGAVVTSKGSAQAVSARTQQIANVVSSFTFM